MTRGRCATTGLTFCALIALLFFAQIIRIAQASNHAIISMNTTSLSIEAPSTIQIGETFLVNITVSEVVDLQHWQIVLYFNRSVLTGLNVTEGPFLKSVGETYFIDGAGILNDYNATHGRIMAGGGFLGYIWVNGSGVLLTIKFNATSLGSSTLILALKPEYWDTILVNKEDEEIPFTFIPNSVTVIPEFSASLATLLLFGSGVIVLLGKKFARKSPLFSKSSLHQCTHPIINSNTEK